MSRARSVSRVGVETTLTISSNGNVGFGSTIPTTRVDVAGNLNVTGVTTSTSFVGNVTGNLTGTASTATAARTAFGLSGTPDITVGIITATVISAGSTVGTAGSVLTSTGTGLQWTSVAVGPQVTTQLASLSNLIGYNNAGLRSDSANGRLEVFGTGNFRVFTSPGTFVVNPGISSIRVRVVGAGGNGGNGVGALLGNRGGSGGGGGGYAHKVITSFTAPRTYTVTVGSAPGGTSSFGAEASATGGSNGNTAPSPLLGGAGGSGSGGDVNFTGATGLSVSSPGTTVGSKGGAAATQKGSGSGASVPGLPSLNYSLSLTTAGAPALSAIFSLYRSIDNCRFPFDIFDGYAAADQGNGGNVSPVLMFHGFNGGCGGNHLVEATPGYSVTNGGNGGTGAGGGGGICNLSNNNGTNGGNGGIGGGGGGGGGSVPGAPAGTGGAGGTGGSGIVIVEW